MNTKYLLHLAYQGTRYHGWQRQPKHPSVQQTIEEALEKMLRQKVTLIGCGRTDTGVHASQYFAHIRVPHPLHFDFDPAERLNHILPEDIAIYEFRPAPADFHAQHSAISRKYTYLLHLRKNPFLVKKSGFYRQKEMDFEKMERATTLLTSVSDFRAMCKQPHLYKHTRCKLTVATLTRSEDGQRLRFDFTADRFLRNMIRLLIGNIIEIGSGRMSVEKFEWHLRNGERPKHFKLARPEGLYLSGVEYENLTSQILNDPPLT